jgi:hypothetical protein
MSVEKLELAIQQLPPPELERLATWFAEYQSAEWDRQIEEDVESGRLDHLIERAEADIAAGRSKPL